MPLNSRAKGAAGERELADEFCRLGLLARRTVQYSGKGGDDADLRVEGLTAHVECKRTEVIRLDRWLEQVTLDCRGKPWIICTRQSRRPWLVIQTLEHWVQDSSDAKRARDARNDVFQRIIDVGPV